MKSTMNLLPLALCFLLFSFTSCKKEKVDNTTEALSMPLLAEGNKIGIINGFNPDNPAATQDSMTARWSEALAAGMPIGRLQIDWQELETSEGVYDQAYLENELERLSSEGLQIFFTLSVYDSEGIEVPPYLEGEPINSKKLIKRFNKMMDWAIPMMVQHNVFVIAVANEPDNSFGEVADLEKQVLEFLQCSKKHIHSIDPRMAVTITQAEGNFDLGKAGMKEIVEASDVAAWNFYGSNYDYSDYHAYSLSPAEIVQDLDEMMAFSGDKLVVIQELGMHSGNVYLDSSEEQQRLFFETVFTYMQTNDRLRAAVVFQMVDWSDYTIELLTEAFNGSDVPQFFVDELKESLGTIGLLHFQDGKRKPAWGEFVNWIRTFQ